MGKIIFAGILTFNSGTLCAANAFVIPELGRSNLSVDETHNVAGFDDQDVGITASVLGGYKFNSNFILALNQSYTDSDLLWGAADNYKIFDVGIIGGYSLDLAPRLRVVPMIGWSYWKFYSTQGQLFNPGPEAEQNDNGWDPFWRPNVEIPVGSLVQLNVSYLNSHYDFGRVTSTRFGAKFEF